MMEAAYKILSREKIDLNRWDSCVFSTDGQSLYGASWYLDATSPGWKGIVKGNYEAVFPLCYKCKFIFKYLYQPVGLQSVKWYSPSPISQLDYFYLFSVLFTKFHFIDINIDLNCTGERKDFSQFEIKATQFLNIKQGTCRRKYSKRVNYSIRKAKRSGIRLANFQDLKLFEKVVKDSKAIVQFGNHEGVCKIINTITQAAKDRGQMWFGYLNDKVVTAAFLIENKGTLYFPFLFTLEEGLNKCVNHYLIDHIIESNSNRFQTLDFSGSNMEGIAFFNKGFGANDRTYVHINTRNLSLRNFIKAIV